MTHEVAIAHIEEVLSEVPNYDETLDYKLTSYDFDWLEEARDALKFRIKKKPLADEKGYMCTCGSYVKVRKRFCGTCGQALDWSEDE